MSARRLASSLAAVLALAGAQSAGAQVTIREGTIQREPTLLTRAPLASVSFTPYQLSALLGDKPIGASLAYVSVSSPGSHVMLQRNNASSIHVLAPQGVPDGVYSVAFTFPWVNQASVVTVSNSSNAVIAQCNLTQQLSYAATAPVQTCEASGISAADLKPGVFLQITQGMQMNVSNITVTRWR